MSKVDYVIWGNMLLAVPEGYIALPTNTFNVGEEVYVIGSNMSEATAYGPHTVHDVEQRMLKNSKGRIFPEPTSHWLVKEREGGEHE